MSAPLSSSPGSRAPAWVRLVRVPNLFTAIADPLAGWFVVGAAGAPAWSLLLVLGASAALYAGGIVLNDLVDYAVDCRDRPERPLPRGEIPRPVAAMVGALLMATGLMLAAAAGMPTFLIAVVLAGLIVLYNRWAKRFAWAGPLVLGACRAANFLLGLRGLPGPHWWMPVALGVYVAALTFIARQETLRPERRLVVQRLLLGIILLDAVFVASQGDLPGALLVAALVVPAACLSRSVAMT